MEPNPWKFMSVEVFQELANMIKGRRTAAEMKHLFMTHFVSRDGEMSFFKNGSRLSEGVGYSIVGPQVATEVRIPGLLINIHCRTPCN